MGISREPNTNDYMLTSPSGEFLATWSGEQPLTMTLVHAMVNEAYRAGERSAGNKLTKIKEILRD